ncbi:MAG: 1-deoxy-D-xylulose-5-phosphate synthase [bacterium]|nr:1-deoxy-D-xylulose-5-phosphate synthase [bacterium]
MNKISMRDAFFGRLYELAIKDKNIMVISADMGAPALDKFRNNLKEQFINVGIAEQNMVTLATGLALSGKKTFIYAIMPFVTARCYEITRICISLMNVPVVAVGVGAGFSYHDSGPTHHSTEDITIMRALPNMVVFNSTDSIMAGKLADISYHLSSPCYIRLDRELLPDIYTKNENFSDGLTVFKQSKNIYIIATGNMVHRAMDVSEELKKHNISAGVIDLYRIKPLNEKLLSSIVKNIKGIVTLEEHFLAGGIGSLVAEFLADNNIKLPLKRIGINDRYYYVYGGRENIQKICGLDIKTIVKEILKWIQKI